MCYRNWNLWTRWFLKTQQDLRSSLENIKLKVVEDNYFVGIRDSLSRKIKRRTNSSEVCFPSKVFSRLNHESKFFFCPECLSCFEDCLAQIATNDIFLTCCQKLTTKIGPTFLGRYRSQPRKRQYWSPHTEYKCTPSVSSNLLRYLSLSLFLSLTFTY